MGIANSLAISRTCGAVCIVFVYRRDLIDAFGELMGDRIFDDVWPLRRRALHDVRPAFKAMNRERSNVGHAAAGVNVSFSVPSEGSLFGFIRKALAERVELKFQVLAQQRLCVLQNRSIGIDAAAQRERAKSGCDRTCKCPGHSAASLPCPSRLLRVLRSFSAASAITVPGGKIASA